ncbi:MAG: dihydroneopterin aldolase, partial [Rubrobacteraceae bacterium]
MSDDRILLEGMTFFGYHGALPAERELGQRFVLDIEMRLDLKPAGLSDDLSKTVDYGAVHDIVKEIVEGE